ncbi:Retrovirus-related Pol polyprotein from type-1 retrotransposable element R2-like Protein [Tribolium castaneum]|uniref:Retrovirus-related Pol polyprotein from type-1 retrotransposable element R2-like Protein n=1 Tax=Tribolium castaneum TaxID=7070 RepID=D7EJ69_TRICA|nr:Retrovirus-related Pol polyprotein from type-1 retrotransposable element R2-like Protein [Tribolium castaneum]
MAGEALEATYWRNRITSGPLFKGLEEAAEDSARGSERDHDRGVQLRTGNLSTKAIPSVSVGQSRCRHGCACDESISHVLQICPLMYGTMKWWLFKPDLAVRQPGGAIVVADVQTSWDSESLTVPYERKRAKYEVPQLHQAAQYAWPSKALTFAPIILGARSSAALQIPSVVR